MILYVAQVCSLRVLLQVTDGEACQWLRSCKAWPALYTWPYAPINARLHRPGGAPFNTDTYKAGKSQLEASNGQENRAEEPH